MNELRSEIKTQQQTIASSRNLIVTLTQRLADLEEEAMLLRMGTVKNIENELDQARKNVTSTITHCDKPGEKTWPALAGAAHFGRPTRSQRQARNTFNNIEPVLKSILYTLKNFESRLKYAELGGDVPACEDKNVRASDLQSNSDTWPDTAAVARTLCSFKLPTSPASCPEGRECCGESAELPKTPPTTCSPCTFPPPPPTRVPRVRNNYSKFFASNQPSRNIQIPPLPTEAPAAEDSGPDTFHEAWDPSDLKSLDLNTPFDDKDCWR